MKILLAHLKKDAATFRPLLWVWALCVAVGCIGFLDRLPLFHSMFEGRGLTIAVAELPLFPIQLVLMIVLIVQVIHADSLTDPDAFWRTRPIPRGVLLAEKLLLSALLLAGAVLTALSMGFRMGNSTAGTLLSAVVFVAGLVAFATVTSRFSKLLLIACGFKWGTLVLAAILLTQVNYFLGRHIHHSFAGYPAFLWHPAEPTISVFYLIGFLSVIVHQYLTLKTKTSRWLLFATFFLGAVMQGK